MPINPAAARYTQRTPISSAKPSHQYDRQAKLQRIQSRFGSKDLGHLRLFRFALQHGLFRCLLQLENGPKANESAKAIQGIAVRP